MSITKNDIRAARILIADHQASQVDMMGQLLDRDGYTDVTSTSDAREAAVLHRKQPFDLILLDFVMPDGDGWGVMSDLQQSAQDPYLPVMVITAEPSHKAQALQAGAKDIISKPIDVLEFQTRIHNALETRLLRKRLDAHTAELERLVAERAAELRASEAKHHNEARPRSDWYWEQNETGEFTTVSGPVATTLGLRLTAFFGDHGASHSTGWNEFERAALQAMLGTRQPFRDFPFSRRHPDGREQRFKVSGEPMFDAQSRFIGFRGIGMEMEPAEPR